MFSVGVDVSNGRSTVAVLDAKRKVVLKPFEVKHTLDGFTSLIEKLNELEGEKRIVMEHTGRYYESFAMTMHSAGFFVSAVNPLVIKNYSEDISVRKVKTDKADALKIAQFALDKWSILPQFTPVDEIRYKLKTLNRQFELSLKVRTEMKNNLIALSEQCYPGVNRYFTSPARADGHIKWVDFAEAFPHVDCVAKLSQKTFVNRYRTWCSKHRYDFSEQEAVKIHTDTRGKIALVCKDDTIRLLVKTAADQLTTVSAAVEKLRAEMDKLSSRLPEYETVMSMVGAGKSSGPQLMAEIGDLRRFPDKKSLVGFAGVDPIKDDSGDKTSKSTPSSKRGSPHLRRTLFIIMTILLQLKPQDDPVYQFLDKKRSEGKKFYVYMTAGMTKFLRVYYGKVKDCLTQQGLWNPHDSSSVNLV